LLRFDQDELTGCIDDLLNVTAQCAPSILILKPKFHYLVHLPTYIRRFGPALLFSTERYESFNHVFRLASIFSNRKSPSRDTCKTFAAQDCIKHVATGGYWRDPGTKKWVQAGWAIRAHLTEHSEHARLLGLPNDESKPPGEIFTHFTLFPLIDQLNRICNVAERS
jgi:hypothetical protein